MQRYVNSVSDVFTWIHEKKDSHSVRYVPTEHWNLRREGDLRAQQLQQQSGDLAAADWTNTIHHVYTPICPDSGWYMPCVSLTELAFG